MMHLEKFNQLTSLTNLLDKVHCKAYNIIFIEEKSTVLIKCAIEM